MYDMLLNDRLTVYRCLCKDVWVLVDNRIFLLFAIQPLYCRSIYLSKLNFFLNNAYI